MDRIYISFGYIEKHFSLISFVLAVTQVEEANSISFLRDSVIPIYTYQLAQSCLNVILTEFLIPSVQQAYTLNTHFHLKVEIPCTDMHACVFRGITVQDNNIIDPNSIEVFFNSMSHHHKFRVSLITGNYISRIISGSQFDFWRCNFWNISKSQKKKSRFFLSGVFKYFYLFLLQKQVKSGCRK